MTRNRFVRGDLVEVRSAAEIASTLDSAGCLDGIPFMPEMAPHCGKRFRVHRRADRTCVEGLGMRRLGGTVFLDELRCDGAAHDGCQRGCLMFWKEAWLKPAPAQNEAAPPVQAVPAQTEFITKLPVKDGDVYRCQSTALATATTPLSRWAPAMLVREMLDGELPLTRFLAIITRSATNKLRVTMGRPAIGALTGPGGGAKGALRLKGGEQVIVKKEPEIGATLDGKGRNRGLQFEPDMAGFTGKVFEVDMPIRRIIHEETGRMRELTSTVTLKGVTCNGICAKNCPRNNPVYWRESWLDRPSAALNAAQPANEPGGAPTPPRAAACAHAAFQPAS